MSPRSDATTRLLGTASYLIAGTGLLLFAPISPYVLPASLAFCALSISVLMSALTILGVRQPRGLLSLGCLNLLIGLGLAVYNFATLNSPPISSAWLLHSNRICLAGLLLLTSVGLLRNLAQDTAQQAGQQTDSTNHPVPNNMIT